jgi:hypothetical protein
VVDRAHPLPAELAELVARNDPGHGLLVADRISEAGRQVLRDAGWSFLDRRGWVRIWVPGVRIDIADPTGDAWTTVGLEVALRGLCRPEEPMSARAVAADIGRSPSYVHDLLARFTHLGLVGARTRRVLVPDLFWETAAHWPDDGWTRVVGTPEDVVAVTGGDDLIRVDERAATWGGARIPAAGDLPARFYVTSAAVLRKVRAAGERADETVARTLVRVAPVRWLPDLDPLPPDADDRWRVAHPIVCALRLAADPARGREVVEQWQVVPGAAGA